MSERKEKVRRALFAKMNVESVTDAGATGIHHMSPPNPPNYPLIVLRDHKSYPVERTWGGVIAEKYDWAIVAQVADSTTPGIGAIAQAEAILTAAEAAIGDSLTLTGAETWQVERIMDLRSDQAVIAGQTIQLRGFILQTVVS